MKRAGALLLMIGLAACNGDPLLTHKQQEVQHHFPAPDRPVSQIVSSSWTNEAERDKLDEFGKVMDGAGVKPGMTVADIGAGEGYYTVRLGSRVGKHGRVLAEDIVAGVRDALADRVQRERLDNVSVRLGEPADPKLPEHSFDRVLMVHMYHEIESPYEFLWNLRPALKRDGIVVVIDADRPTQAHGTPPALLTCEFGAVGYKLLSLKDMPAAGGYLALFQPAGPRPVPETIKACPNLPAHIGGSTASRLPTLPPLATTRRTKSRSGGSFIA